MMVSHPSSLHGIEGVQEQRKHNACAPHCNVAHAWEGTFFGICHQAW